MIDKVRELFPWGIFLLGNFFLGDILLGDNALFQLYKLQPFLSELFLVCLAALLLTLCTFLILTCFLFKLFASFLCVYLTDSLHKGLGLLLFAACFFVFGFCAVQLIFFFFVIHLITL